MLKIPESRLERAEWIAGLALTALALYLHVRALTHAGPLWRDEANMVAVATRATWGAVGGALEHESFPLLPFAVVRIWSALGIGASDIGLRALGFLVGAGILCALWIDAALLGIRVPLLSLSLFALSPVVIRWGDSLRAYGMGTLVFLLLYGVAFRASRRDRPPYVAISALAVLAVQCMYQNALLLVAVAAAAVLAAEAGRRGRTIAAFCGAGAVAAASLLPYRGVIARARDHFVVITLPSDPARIGRALSEALGRFHPEMGGAGKLLWLAWLAAYLAAAVVGITILVRRRREGVETDAASVYGLVVLLLAPAAILVFLLRLSFLTEPWYFVLLMGAVAVSLDTVLGAGTLRTLRVVVACLVAVISIVPVHAILGARQTNVDLISRQLERRAGDGDLIVVDPWFIGISFNRYYRGHTPWVTIPPLAEHEIHRFDLIKEQMMLPEPLRPILDRAASTLKSGHYVWIVGFLDIPPPGAVPKKLPLPPAGPKGWYSDPYLGSWRAEFGYFLRNYGGQGESIPVPAPSAVNSYEEMPLWKIEGWVGG